MIQTGEGRQLAAATATISHSPRHPRPALRNHTFLDYCWHRLIRTCCQFKFNLFLNDLAEKGDVFLLLLFRRRRRFAQIAQTPNMQSTTTTVARTNGRTNGLTTANSLERGRRTSRTDRTEQSIVPCCCARKRRIKKVHFTAPFSQFLRVS